MFDSNGLIDHHVIFLRFPVSWSQLSAGWNVQRAVLRTHWLTPGSRMYAWGRTPLSQSGAGCIGFAAMGANLSGSGVATLNIGPVPQGIAPGAYQVWVYGAAGNLTRVSAPFTLQINGSGAYFSIGATTSSLSIPAGASGTSGVNVAAFNGFSGAVSFTASGQPSGVTVGFVPSSINTAGSSTATIAVPGTAAAGTYSVTITGTSGGVSHSVPVTLTVTGGSGSPVQTITTSPPGLSITVDGSPCLAPCGFQWAQIQATRSGAGAAEAAGHQRYTVSVFGLVRRRSKSS